MKKMMLIFLIFILTTVWFVPVQADKLSDYKNKKSTVDNKLNNISAEKSKIKRQINAKKDEKQALLDAEKRRTKEFNDLLEQKRKLDKTTAELNSELKLAEQKLDDQKELLKKRLRVMYENSNSSYLQTLIESKSIVDFYERLQLISAISKSDHDLFVAYGEAKKDVAFKKQMIEQKASNTADKANDKVDAIRKITQSRDGVEGDLKKFQSELDQLEKQEDDLIKQSEALSKEIKSLMSKKKYMGGVMQWPVPSATTITSSYGMRYHPILRKRKMHTGIDIAAKRGASITAAAKGTVIKAGWENGFGNTVVIDHGGGIATLYAHASKILVSVGDSVEAGQTIAKIGTTGLSTGPHLHFEVIANGATKNPIKYVSSN